MDINVDKLCLFQVPGRIVSGDDGDKLQVESKQIICTIYLLVGMALVAMCFNLMQEEAIENLKVFWRSLGCLRRQVKRGRDKIRGKRRRSALGEDELELAASRERYEQWTQAHQFRSAGTHLTDRTPLDNRYSAEATSARKATLHTGFDRSKQMCSTAETAHTVTVYSTHNEQMNDMRCSKKLHNASENIEMKCYKNTRDKQWHLSKPEE